MNSKMFSWLKTERTKLNIIATYDLVYNASLFVKKGFGYVIALDKLINTTKDSNLCSRPLASALEADLCTACRQCIIAKAWEPIHARL